MRKTIAPHLTSTFLCLAVAATTDTTARGADEKDPGTKLALSSGYGHGLPGANARSVHLSVTLDDKGAGKGKLALDPNRLGIDRFGDFTGKSTTIAVRELEVTLEEVKLKGQAKGGRRLFEVKGHGLDNRLFLVIPPKGSTTYRLVTVDKEGQGLDVLLLEPVTRGNDPPDARKELAKLEGVWAFESQTVAGKDVAKELLLPAMHATIKGDTLVRSNGGFSVESKIDIDPTKQPKAIDLVTRLPGGGLETGVGIYELSGDSLKICYDPTGKQRPKEFKSAEGSTVVLSVLKRQK